MHVNKHTESKQNEWRVLAEGRIIVKKMTTITTKRKI